MKNYKIKILIVLGLMFSVSCEDYLDVAPESVLSEEEVFSTFKNAQGFVEEMYALVVSYEMQTHTFQDYLFGDDAYVERVGAYKASRRIDEGTFNSVTTYNYSYLSNWKGTSYGNTGADVTGNNAFNKQRPGVWDASMRGIRKANIVIANIDLMVDASQAERDVILGQAYFFRAFFHNEIMKFWGRFPYIDKVITDDYALPRPKTYKECALAANEDYIRAAELLPNNWDEEIYGRLTNGENKGRLTKGAAYAFQGKNLLLAASPLMYGNNGAMNTYQYDTELCDMAVDAFAEVLKLTDQGYYALSSWENYDEVFWKSPTPNAWPGSTEFIFAATGGNADQARRFMSSGVNREISTGGDSSIFSESISPTHNFIHQNFGMANGLSTDHPESGYDATKPFDNRDPRFYRWHIIDGQVITTKAPENQRTAELWYESTGSYGKHRSSGTSNKHCTTGYMFTKFYPKVDGEYNHQEFNPIIKEYAGMRMHMRLTDVYLMYAEALHASKGATAAPDSYGLTAEATVNLFRDRAGIPSVDSAIVGDSNKFMDELRRERAVELCYEAHRWVDIRRWGVAHLDQYRIKTALDFSENQTNFVARLLVDRICEYPKHYWLPFEAKQTQIYEGFDQNPGW
ncbi:MAG: RagB/SusD family nutrient uptake outer membrane protein [Wenyingzhuangia sp.]|uniref:RagB/SusD family nutrient uptake outer membrane protein n=3 Tax=Wenyingzhuangia sp. TaxID=1964193 RepID=UPI00321B80F9